MSTEQQTADALALTALLAYETKVRGLISAAKASRNEDRARSLEEHLRDVINTQESLGRALVAAS